MQEKSFEFEVPVHVVLIGNGFASLSTDSSTDENPEFAVAIFPDEQSAENFNTQLGIEGSEVRTIYTIKDLVQFLRMFKKPHTHIAWNPQIIEGEVIKTDWIGSIEDILSQLPPVSSEENESRPAPWQYPAYVMKDSSPEQNYVSINAQMPDGKPVFAVVLFSSSSNAEQFKQKSQLRGVTILKVENHTQMTQVFKDWLPQFNAVAVDPVVGEDGKQNALCLWTESLWEKYFIK